MTYYAKRLRDESEGMEEADTATRAEDEVLMLEGAAGGEGVKLPQRSDVDTELDSEGYATADEHVQITSEAVKETFDECKSEALSKIPAEATSGILLTRAQRESRRKNAQRKRTRQARTAEGKAAKVAKHAAKEVDPGASITDIPAPEEL